MSTNPVSHVSPEEYFELERLSEERHEYVYGEIVAVGRPLHAHGVIVNNVAYELRVRMKPKGCRVFHESLRVAVGWGDLIAYPDVVLVCGDPQWVSDKYDALTNPRFLVEVLSPSTRDYDRATKSGLYRTLSSISEYLFIDPNPVFIEHLRRHPNGNWEIATIRDREATLQLESLGREIPVADIYDDVERYLRITPEARP
jgi:Uma2 family endonuclease